MGKTIEEIKDRQNVIKGINHLKAFDPKTKGMAQIIPIQPALDPVRMIKTKTDNKKKNIKNLLIFRFLLITKNEIANGQIILSHADV